MRSLFAWAIGIVTAMLLMWIGTEALALLGVPTWIDFGETVTVTRGSGPTSYDEEIDGEHTIPGTILYALSYMIAARIGMWVYTGKPNGGVSVLTELQFRTWLLGLVSFGAASTALWIADINPVVHNVLEIAAAAAIAWCAYKWYEARVSALANEDRARHRSPRV